jgi:hypothetical protein
MRQILPAAAAAPVFHVSKPAGTTLFPQIVGFLY